MCVCVGALLSTEEMSHLFIKSAGINSTGQVKTMCVDSLRPTQTVVQHRYTTVRYIQCMRRDLYLDQETPPITSLTEYGI